MKKEDIIKIINEKYKDYEGYVQFSHRPIDKEKDIFFEGKKVNISDEDGFIYEAHFYNGTESIQIKQINDSWLISTSVNISDKDIQLYVSDIKDFNYKIKMAQIWEAEEDLLCELDKNSKDETIKGFKVKKLKKVVFVGFKKEDQNDNSTI